jgi:hypothetical protein
MREDQIDQAERKTVLENDRKILEQQQQGSTFKAFADAEARIPGRFESIAAAHVVGSTSDPAQAYPAASTAHQTNLPPEPPTGYCVDEMTPLEPSAVFSSPVEHLAPAGAPTSSSVAPPPLVDGADQASDAGASFSSPAEQTTNE